MLTSDQKNWLNKLSDANKVKIIPYDPKVLEIFKQKKSYLKSILGKNAQILHKGASAWGISGKGDIDIYIPVMAKKFESTFSTLKLHLGDPGSYYPNERARWNSQEDNIDIEYLLTNKEATFWQELELFWDYIETHPVVLREYELLKASCDGKSTKYYYTQKIMFFNNIQERLSPLPKD